MTKQIITPEFIRIISQRAGFTQGDVKEIYNAIVEMFEESARDGVELKLKGFGKLYYQMLDERNVSGYTGSDGVFHPPVTHPPTTKIVFRLAENIRYADKGDD
jgi:nucleoid DNA-binding protein